MATLKEHQAAMVDLLANGSGIPASASRLAHALHDVLSAIINGYCDNTEQLQKLLNDATTPGLNDKALSKPKKALKTDSPSKWPTPAEQRVKELTNTVAQLRKQSAQYRATIAGLRADVDSLKALVFAYENGAEPEQAGCRKEDTQACSHVPKVITPGTDGFPDGYLFCEKCGENLAKDFRTKEAEGIALGKELGGYL